MNKTTVIASKIEKMQVAAPTLVNRVLHYQKKFHWSDETTELCLHWMILSGVKTIQDMENAGIKINNYTRAFQYWALRSFEAFAQVANN